MYQQLKHQCYLGRYEGDSTVELKEEYIRLGSSEKVSAIIIDDFDISITANRDNVERTSNSDILNLFLMHICDDPTTVGNHQCKPVPIILTGNNFNNLYPPLIRSGRTTIFTWSPDANIMFAMVSSLFKEFSITPEEIQVLIRKHKSQPISFFQQIISHIIDDIADIIINDDDLQLLTLLI